MRTSLPVLAALLLGCTPDASSPTADAAAAPPSASAPASAYGAAAASGSANVDAAPHAQSLGAVGDVTIAAYPPTGFERLAPEERVLAYHLAAAAWAGDSLKFMQTSRWGWPVLTAMNALAKGEQNLPADFAPKLATYRRMLYIHHGIHEEWTGRKYLPPFTRAELEAAAKDAHVEIAKDVLDAMFDPKIAPAVTNKSPGPGKDPLVESAANHYEGVSTKDLEGMKERYELNGRIVKRGGKIVEEVYRAGGQGAPPGLGAEQLGRVVKHLREAISVAKQPAQREALEHLVTYFETGDNAAFKAHDIAWLKQVFPVDYILGFVETYTDVRERKGAFEGFVAIPDPERDPPLQALAKNAQYFEQKMPWSDEWKRDSFRVPAAAAVIVLAGTGDAGPFTFLGVNLPNGQELREKYGSKNFVVLSVGDTREELVGKKTIDEFAPEESRAEIHRCARYLEYVATGFHEVTGHGSGKVSPKLAADPSKLLAPYYSTMEEGRAELVADWLAGDPKTIEIGLLPDAGCAKAFAQYKVTSASLRVKWVTTGDVAEEDHLRADLIWLGVLKEKGVVTLEQRAGKTFWVVKDVEAWRKASGELLAEHQRIKATGDKPALKALVEKYGTRIDTKWRDEVLARLKALDLPRVIAMLPPTLVPVRDTSGNVVDAKAVMTKSLDDYIALLERASRD